MRVSFDGIGQVCATFLGSGLSEGQVVRMTGSGTAGACGDGEGFCGAAICCKDDACSVQVRGFVTVSYTGTAPSAGWAALCGNGQGGVRAVSSAEGSTDESTRCLVVDVDTTAKAVTILL